MAVHIQQQAHMACMRIIVTKPQTIKYDIAELSPHILKRDTTFTKVIAVRHGLAITLYWLADTAQYRTIANLFGVGKSTVCGIVKQVCEVIVRIFLHRCTYVPQS